MIAAPGKTVSYDRAAMRDVVLAQVTALKQLGASELQGLPARAVTYQAGEAPVTINQYHEASEDSGEHKVVVQASRDP